MPIGNTLDMDAKFAGTPPIPCVINVKADNQGWNIVCSPVVTQTALTFDLVVEQFDNNSSVLSTLKKDTVSVTVTAYNYVTFREPLEDIVISDGSPLANFVNGLVIG